MRVLFITHGPDMMGANRCMLDLISSLKPSRLDSVILLPAQGELSNKLDELGIKKLIHPYFNLAFTRYISLSFWLHPLRAFQNIKSVRSLTKMIDKQGFDLIYSNSSLVGIGAMVAQRLNLPHIWHIREFGEKDYNQSFWRGRKYFNKWANRSSAVIAMSQAIHDEVLKEITAPKFIIHDGIISKEELDKIPVKPNGPSLPFTFLIIGLIHPTKGQLTAVRAFNKILPDFPGSRLLIAGKGRRHYTQKIAQFIRKHRIGDNVELLGYVTNPYEIHSKADVVLMCSKSEGMGRVTLEAMVFSNPVIGFNGGATPELVKHRVNGLIYSRGVEELAACMRELANAPGFTSKLGRNGRKMIEQDYTLEISAGKILAIMQEVLSTNKV